MLDWSRSVDFRWYFTLSCVSGESRAGRGVEVSNPMWVGLVGVAKKIVESCYLQVP